jgi:hypothetical protein
MTDDKTMPDQAEPGPTPEAAGPADETFGWTTSGADAKGAAGPAREWLTQLQTMIENLAEQAGPVIRDVGIKAAELAALAGEKAGPVAHRAAEVTAEAGHRLAEKSRDLAAELRREREASHEAEPTPDAAPEPVGPATGEIRPD